MISHALRFPTKILATIIAIAGVTGGCIKPIVVNAFDGPAPPGSQLALMTITEDVRLTSLDGKPLEGMPPELDKTKDIRSRAIRLLPGTHRLLAGMRSNTFTSYPHPAGPT